MRFVRLANAFGPEFRYTIVAMDGAFDAAGLLRSDIAVDLAAPDNRRLPHSAMWLRSLIRRVSPDLVITNNWGAIDAVLASLLLRLCPTIHSEDGFGSDEAIKLKPRRVLTRRLLLNQIHTTVLPSKTLLRIAREQYRVRESKLTYIPNGIDTDRFRPGLCSDLRQKFCATPDTTVFGFLGHLRPEKTVDVLIQAFAKAHLSDAVLILVGDGPCRPQLETLARDLGVANDVYFAGHTDDPQPYLSAFDVVALSSATEQMPLCVLEAMACGLPVISTDVGDCAEMLGTRTAPVITPRSDVAAYSTCLSTLAQRPDLRIAIGEANRVRCANTYSLGKMTTAYARLYENAMDGRKLALAS